MAQSVVHVPLAVQMPIWGDTFIGHPQQINL